MSSRSGDRHSDSLLAAEPSVVAEYRRRLQEQQSSLVEDPEVWAECALQARRIIADVAESLRQGRPGINETHIPSVVDMAERRGGRGIHPTSSTRAAAILFEVVLDEIRRLAGDGPDAAALVADAALSLNRGIGARLEAGATGYDAFLLNQVRLVNDKDRRQLAREIHDRVGNSISLAIRQLELEALLPVGGGDDGPGPVDSAREVLFGAMTDLRDVITGLRAGRGEGALRGALNAYVASVQLPEPVVAVSVNGVESWARPQVLDELFLVLRECLRNAYAHAQAREIAVKVDVAPHEIWALVEDDGVGFDPASVRRAGRGHGGLTAMHERVEEQLAGSLTMGAGSEGDGTRVSIWIPLPRL
jgi:signal transduction histidine kinase